MAGGHLFVSYSRQDGVYVARLVRHLRDSGIECWFDEEVPTGTRWSQILSDKIDSSAGLLLVMSSSARLSHWVGEEVARATIKRKPIYPLLLEGEVFFGLATVQYEDVRGARMPSDRFVDGLRGNVELGPVPEVQGTWQLPHLNLGVVDRPELVGQLLAALTNSSREKGVTAGLFGAAGFGKTTMAALLCRRDEVRQHFTGGLLWASIGEAAGDADLAAIIADLCLQLSGERPSFASLEQAGYRLGELLDRHAPVLLVIDGAWNAKHLRAMLLGGERASRLVTTQILGLLPDDAIKVQVDRMSDHGAKDLLAAGLEQLDGQPLADLLDRCGGWALLLSIVNAYLRRSVRNGLDVRSAAIELVERLAQEGPATFDVVSQRSRSRAVADTVKNSLKLLPGTGQRRFLELSIFPENEPIGLAAVGALWNATGEVSSSGTRDLVEEMADLSLLAEYSPAAGTLRLHEVIRSYARHVLLKSDRVFLNATLLNTYAATLERSTGDANGTRPWWTLPSNDYMWRHLAYHLVEADCQAELVSRDPVCITSSCSVRAS